MKQNNLVWENISFIINIPETLKKYNKEQLSEILEWLEKEYNVEWYIDWNNFVVNANNFPDACEFLDNDFILWSEYSGRETNYSLIIWNRWLTPNFLNVSDYFINQLFEILTEDILYRYNNVEYWDQEDIERETDEDKKEDILFRYNNLEYWYQEDIEEYFNENSITDDKQKEYIINWISKK